MKKFKALTAVLLALMFVLFAMGSGEKSPEKPVADDDVVVNDIVDVDEPTEAPTPVKKEVSRGTIVGDVYTNDFVGVTFTKPADWTYATDEEIAQTINVGQDMIDLNAFEEALSKTASIYDMYAVDAYGNNVMVCYENTMLTAFRELTVDEYESILISNITGLASPSYTFEGSEDVTLGDTTFRKTTFTATYEGVTLTQAYYGTIIDQYAVSIILTSSTMDLATMEAMFS